MSRNGCRQMSSSLKVFDILEKWHNKSKEEGVKRQENGRKKVVRLFVLGQERERLQYREIV